MTFQDPQMDYEDGPVDALTEAERADMEHALGDCVECGENRGQHVDDSDHEYVAPVPSGPCDHCGGVIRCVCDDLYEAAREARYGR